MLFKRYEHLRIRNMIEHLVTKGYSDFDISKQLGLDIGTRWVKNSVRWYKFCISERRPVSKRRLSDMGKKAMMYRKRNGTFINFQKHAARAHHMKYDGTDIQKGWGHKGGTISGPTVMMEYHKKYRGTRNYIVVHRKNGLLESERRRMNGTLLSICSKAGKRCKELHPNQLSEMGLKGIRTKRLNRPYWFKNIPFDSKEERDVAKWFVKNHIISNINRKNCHIQLKNGEIDFLLRQKIFVEYHPWDPQNRTPEQYFYDRRKLLDSNGYLNYPLIVINSFDQLGVINWKEMFNNAS